MKSRWITRAGEDHIAGWERRVRRSSPTMLRPQLKDINGCGFDGINTKGLKLQPPLNASPGEMRLWKLQNGLLDKKLGAVCKEIFGVVLGGIKQEMLKLMKKMAKLEGPLKKLPKVPGF